MAKTPTNEIFSTLKGYFSQITEGERTPSEVASAFNEWARESAESVKAKIAEEVETTVAKMGFIKREEYEKLVTRVAVLEKGSAVKKVTKKAPAKTVKKVAKKATVKKASK